MDFMKTLGRVAPSTVNLTTVYEAPGLSPPTYDGGNIQAVPNVAKREVQVVVSSIVVANLDALAGAFSIIVLDASGDTPANENYLAKSVAIAANTSKVIHFGILLSEGNTIQVQSADANRLAFNVFGTEIS